VEVIGSDHIKFAPDTLARLGEELIPNPDQGIIELVRNAYDADASKCVVDFSKAFSVKSTITIRDTGDGMTVEAIRNGWFVLGHSVKADERNRRTKKGRLPVGDKGLGRLAALRMGRSATLETRPKAQPGVMYKVTFDWNEYAGKRLVEDVVFKIEKAATTKKPGTDIILNDVQARFGRRELDRLARNILLLSDPFSSTTGFKAVLIAPGFKDLEAKVRRAYFDDAEYRLQAQLSSKGTATAQLLDWGGRVMYRANHEDISTDSSIYRSIPAELSLWGFLLSAESFSGRKSGVTEVREWLSVVGGVHLYYRHLRVPPYGDRGHDWLEMNLARARNPEERPSTNNSIGRVVVEDPQHVLTQKTDRIGFIEGEEFQELKRFAIDALEWMAKIRMQEAEMRRERERVAAPKTVAKAVEKLDRVVEEIPRQYRESLTEAIRRVEKAAKREARVLRDDLQLYRSLATAGTTAAVFAHEAAKPISRISDLINIIRKRALGLLGKKYGTLEKPVDLLERSSTTLKSFAAIPIYLLKREKRKSEHVNVQKVIANVLEVFDPILKDAKIFVTNHSAENDLYILGSIALLEAIITNFLTNSVQAFGREESTTSVRKIVLTIEASGNSVVIDFSDNGPGIEAIKMEEIWLPGRTTLPGGTGFGLTIVKDAVADLGGSVRAIAHSELGGAEFIVRLPLVGD